MQISSMHWRQVEAYLAHDDRAIVPLGSTEQHATLSLSTDSILAERVATEAAEPLGLPVFPALAYGVAPYFRRFPGTVTLRLSTYLCVIEDMLGCLYDQGFRRIVFVNGHGGNSPAQTVVDEWLASRPAARVRWHNWWNAPRTWAHVQATDPLASHASWMENFPWTRLAGVAQPDVQVPMLDVAQLREAGPDGVRAGLGDGIFGGRAQRPDDEMLAIWQTAVAETRAVIERAWDA